MKKTFALLFIAAVMSALTYSCSDDYDSEFNEPVTRVSGEDGGEDDPYAGMYLDENSGQWLIPCQGTEETNSEPGISTMSMTIPPGPWTPPPFDPKPVEWITFTMAHYLKIWPKSQDEIDELRSIEGVVISYHPFVSQPVPNAVLERLGRLPQVPSAVYPKYLEYEEGYVSDGEELPARTVAMPVLYAIWPIQIFYPEWMDYEITGDITEQQMVYHEPPPSTGGGVPPITSVYPHIIIQVKVDSLASPVRLGGIRVRLQTKSGRSEEGWADKNGFIRFSKAYEPSATTVTVFFEHKHFWIERHDRVPQYTWEMKKSGTQAYTLEYKQNETPHYAIFMGASYWFEYQTEHKLSTSCGESGKVRLIDQRQDTSSDGKFFFRGNGKTRIQIRNGNRADHKIFCTTTHEMEHGSMYANNRTQYGYGKFDKILRESWARFTGWYLTNKAYEGWGYNKGWVYGKNPQSWDKISGDSYSPLFIDLMDDYNQQTIEQNKNNPDYLAFPNDDIKNVSTSVIEYLAFHCTSRTKFELEGLRFVNSCYTREQFYNYFRPYHDNWHK